MGKRCRTKNSASDHVGESCETGSLTEFSELGGQLLCTPPSMSTETFFLRCWDIALSDCCDESGKQ